MTLFRTIMGLIAKERSGRPLSSDSSLVPTWEGK